MKFQVHFPYIIWWAILLHIAWGIALIINTEISPATILVGLHWTSIIGISRQILGITLLLAAIIAASGLLIDKRVSRQIGLIMLMPQYAILIASFIADSQSIVTGLIETRTVDRLLLFTVLSPVMIAAILHSIAIIDRYLSWNRR